jgi:hypothetical protein
MLLTLSCTNPRMIVPTTSIHSSHSCRRKFSVAPFSYPRIAIAQEICRHPRDVPQRSRVVSEAVKVNDKFSQHLARPGNVVGVLDPSRELSARTQAFMELVYYVVTQPWYAVVVRENP